MLLLGLDPMANLAPVIPPAVEYYDTRSRRPSGLEQIIESENGSQTPSSSASDKGEAANSPIGSEKDLDLQTDKIRSLDKDRNLNLKRNRYSASDICEVSERLLPSRSSPSTYSLKNNDKS